MCTVVSLLLVSSTALKPEVQNSYFRNTMVFKESWLQSEKRGRGLFWRRTALSKQQSRERLEAEQLALRRKAASSNTARVPANLQKFGFALYSSSTVRVFIVLSETAACCETFVFLFLCGQNRNEGLELESFLRPPPIRTCLFWALFPSTGSDSGSEVRAPQ